MDQQTVITSVVDDTYSFASNTIVHAVYTASVHPGCNIIERSARTVSGANVRNG